MSIRNYSKTQSDNNFYDAFYCGNRREIYGPLKKKEQMELFGRYHNGDMSAAKELIDRNIGLLMTMANKLEGQMPYSKREIISYGYDGLAKAIERYDPDQGFSFTSYAAKTIKNELIMNLNIYNKEMIIDVDEYDDDEKYTCNMVDNYVDVDTTDEDMFIKGIIREENGKLVERLLSNLSELQRDVVTKHLGLYGNGEMTLNEIAEKRGCSHENVRRAWNRSLEILKDRLSRA